MVRDPVCGMNIDEKTTRFKSEYKGKIYYFCSKLCKDAFDRDPAKYTGY
ncbi:MAG: YHS domain-containing protein [Nitrososphaerota archaeon]|nr:YHS domain-containing protein [Candidatus Bathyarchaeota archaeon]MDW8061423.1 YHS domain-containing protein [Nitrososphaerota archaeon]